MSVFRFLARCPVRGSQGGAARRDARARAEYSPLAPQLAGGITTALVFTLSRKRRFRCERCGGLFYSHTFSSRVWLALWVWCCVGLA